VEEVDDLTEWARMALHLVHDVIYALSDICPDEIWVVSQIGNGSGGVRQSGKAGVLIPPGKGIRVVLHRKRWGRGLHHRHIVGAVDGNAERAVNGLTMRSTVAVGGYAEVHTDIFTLGQTVECRAAGIGREGIGTIFIHMQCAVVANLVVIPGSGIAAAANIMRPRAVSIGQGLVCVGAVAVFLRACGEVLEGMSIGIQIGIRIIHPKMPANNPGSEYSTAGINRLRLVGAQLVSLGIVQNALD